MLTQRLPDRADRTQAEKPVRIRGDDFGLGKALKGGDENRPSRPPAQRRPPGRAAAAAGNDTQGR